MADFQAFLQLCRTLDDGFLASFPQAAWRIGAILLARQRDRLAVVRKAPVQPGRYEFEGLWALPGGMVRATDASLEAEPAIRIAIETRAAKEAGIDFQLCSERLFAEALGPVITSYTAKGAKRYTLVAAMTCHVAGRLDLAKADHSVDATCWASLPPEWSTYAPANRLILGHLLWDVLGTDGQEDAREPIAEAVAQCALWAVEAGVAPAVAPWDSLEALLKWKRAWPLV